MKHFKQLTSLCLVLTILFAQSASASSAVLTRALEIISKMETNGNYGSVANDSNGSPSVGILQWNNGRAVSLLKKIIADDPEAAKSLLGDALYEQLSSGKTSVWSGKKLSTAQKSSVGALLKTDNGIKRQNEQAKTDIQAYVDKAKSLGITDGNALVYYSDIAHQAGTGAVKKYAVKAAEIAGSYGKITLKDMYQAALVYATYTKSRRTKVYNLLSADPVEASEEPAVILPTSVTISPSTKQTLYLGDTLTLSAAVKPDNATATFTWSSSDEKIATVSGGVVTPLKAGKATISVKTQNGKNSSVKLVVKPVLVSKVSLSGSNVMKRGTTQTLVPSLKPSNATNQKVKWRSSNAKIASVNSEGIVKAKKKGKVTIYCMAKDSSKKLRKFKIKIK